MKNLKKIMNKLKETSKTKRFIKDLKKAYLREYSIKFDNEIVPFILEQENKRRKT